MNARSVVAGLVVLALAVPTVGAVHGSDQHQAGCGSGVPQTVAEETGVRVDPSDDCGVSYDSDGNDVTVSATFDHVRIDSWSYPHSIVEAVPSSIDLQEGLEHPLRAFVADLDAAADRLGIEDTTDREAEVWMDGSGTHLAVEDEQADVPWPRDPLTGQQLIDHERVHVPARFSVSTADVVAFLDRTCRERVDADVCPEHIIQAAPASPPTLTVNFAVEAGGTGGIGDRLSVAGAAAGDRIVATQGTAPSARSDGADGATPIERGETAASASEADLDPIPQPAETLPTIAVATALLVALGALAGYRRLEGDEILEHSLRHRIYDYILENPGTTVQELADALEVDYSTAKHHASVLKDFDLVHRRTQGRVTHYFENHGAYDAFEKEAIPLLRDGTSAEIAQVVRDHPNITPSAVARRLDVDPSTVKWHVDKLRSADILDVEPLDGRSIGLDVPEPARELVDRWA